MTELEQYLKGYFGVSDAEVSKIRLFFKPVKLKKGDFFLRSGKMSDRLGFIQTGIVREFVDHDGKEITKWISTKGFFAVDLASFLFQRPARWNIQALAESELLVIEKADYQKIREHVARWEELEKLFIAKCFIVLGDRVVQHLALSAEERYQQLFDYNKELFNTVPLQFLASMLGMTPETLSRLRKKNAP